MVNPEELLRADQSENQASSAAKRMSRRQQAREASARPMHAAPLKTVEEDLDVSE